MTRHEFQFSQIDLLSTRPPKVRLLDRLDLGGLAKRLVVFNPSGQAIDELAKRAKRSIPGLAGSAAAHRVMSHNPDTLWGITRRDIFDTRQPVAEGLIAFLMLNHEGLRELSSGRFNGTEPDLSLLARQNEKPAGIYTWLVYAPGTLAAGVPLVLQKISTPLYADVDLYANATTAAGHRFVEAIGFRQGAVINGVHVPHLHTFPRSKRQEEWHTASDAAMCKSKKVFITTAQTFEDLFRVISVRAAVYMAEQECPYKEEFDGNDLAATHLLCYVGDEPAGCIRIRCFADFAKIERLAVRKEFRGYKLAQELAHAAIELCRAKGYTRLYGHAARHMVRFWSRLGFRVLENASEFVFSDFEYIEMVADVDRSPHAVTIGGNPYVLLRPEGLWHTAGILETSAGRGVTRPSIGEIPS